MTLISWLPLAVFVIVLIAAELIALLTDRSFRARRELYRAGAFAAFGAMEKRGMRVRQVVLGTEARGGPRSLVRRFNVIFWIVVGVMAAMPFILGWAWWISALLIGLLLAWQTVDIRDLLQLRQREETASKGRAAARTLTHVLAAVTIVVGVLALGWALDPRNSLSLLLWRILVVAVAIGVLYASIALLWLAQRFGSVVDQLSRFGADASRDDVLLLRSFKDDELGIRAVDAVLGRLSLLVGYRTRFEEYLANMLLRDQRLIAIGKPGEALPALGAVRTYFTDDTWQDAIDSTVRRVGTIVMVAAGTGGFEWELNLLSRTGNLPKTLILIPPIGVDASIDRMRDLMVRLGINVFDDFDYDDLDEWGAVFLLSLVGIGFTREGRPIFYLGMGRDWAAYAGALVLWANIASGRLTPLKHGELARRAGIEMELEDQ